MSEIILPSKYNYKPQGQLYDSKGKKLTEWSNQSFLKPNEEITSSNSPELVTPPIENTELAEKIESKLTETKNWLGKSVEAAKEKPVEFASLLLGGVAIAFIGSVAAYNFNLGEYKEKLNTLEKNQIRLESQMNAQFADQKAEMKEVRAEMKENNNKTDAKLDKLNDTLTELVRKK